MSSTPVLHCPACRARFRGTVTCSRCGADLGPLMRLATRGHLQRAAARRALLAGEIERALELATAAQRLQLSEAGRALVALARALRVSGLVAK